MTLDLLIIFGIAVLSGLLIAFVSVFLSGLRAVLFWFADFLDKD